MSDRHGGSADGRRRLPGAGLGLHPGRSAASRVGIAVACGVAALLAGLGASAVAAGGASDAVATNGRAVVVSVVDGDTVELEIGGRPERVRLLGIDAPESVHPSVPVQCFGPEASAALSEMLTPGTVVRTERDLEARDRYGRLLLYLYRADDNLFVNGWLVRTGLADTSFYEPNTALASPLNKARSQARAEHAGLWGNCDGPDQPLE